MTLDRDDLGRDRRDGLCSLGREPGKVPREVIIEYYRRVCHRTYTTPQPGVGGWERRVWLRTRGGSGREGRERERGGKDKGEGDADADSELVAT